jgi:hypothetical protein
MLALPNAAPAATTCSREDVVMGFVSDTGETNVPVSNPRRLDVDWLATLSLNQHTVVVCHIVG